MSERKNPAYEDGVAAARRTGKYADADADIRNPHETETPEGDDWWRGYTEEKRAMESEAGRRDH